MTIQEFFKDYPCISQGEIAERAGINPSLFRQYVTGIKTPSKTRLVTIEKAIRQLGKELAKESITDREWV